MNVRKVGEGFQAELAAGDFKCTIGRVYANAEDAENLNKAFSYAVGIALVGTPLVPSEGL